MASVSLVENTNSIGPLQFDAVMEDTEEVSVRPARFPIDSNATPSDHAVVLPDAVTMVVCVGDNPLNNSYDYMSAAKGIGLSAFSDGGFDSSFVSANTAADAAIFSAGAPASRSGATMSTLRALVKSRATFTVVSSKGTYTDMMITSVRKTTNVENQAALMAEIKLQEMPKINPGGGGLTSALGSEIGEIFAPVADFGRKIGRVISS